MSAARSKARTRAFQILFEADHRGVDPQQVLADWVARAREPKPDEGTPQVGEYTMELIEGYVQHARRIDELIEQYAVGWTLDEINKQSEGIYSVIDLKATPEVVKELDRQLGL
ncbi:transcription antitermination factor NusB, partial [Kitasatospora sp. NPDC001159]